MKNMMRFNKTLILLLLVSAAAFGQYTGTNPNVATSRQVVATDSITGFEPGNAVDGSLATHCAIPGGAGAWVQINLGTYHYIDGYGMVLPYDTELPRTFILQVSADGAIWTDLATQSVSNDSTFTADVDSPDPIRFVRIYMTAKDTRATFSEIYIYGVPMQVPERPTAVAATNITSTAFTANWLAAARAEGYVISVATDPGFTNKLPGYDKWDYDVLSWNVTDLAPGTTYYYKIRAFNLAGTSTFGNAISVTTLKGTQTISFDALEASVYGDSNFDLTATATSGLAVSYASSDETVATISGSTVTITGTGTTTITATQEGDGQYLAATPVMQDLVVNVKDLSVINAIAGNKEYDGNTHAVVTGAALEGVVGEDIVTLTNAEAGIFAQSGIGTGILVTTSMALGGADKDNYSLTTSPDLTADITAKELTVAATDMNREACEANPEFTVSYLGFAGTEDESVVVQEPVASCSANAGSPQGLYDITVSGGSAPNYVMVYVSGKLTVTPDVTPPSLEVQDYTVQLDASGNGVITAANLVVSSGDNCGVTGTALSKSIFSVSDIGEVNVDVTVSDAAGNETTLTAVVTVVGYVGLEELNGFKVKVYPNPTYGTVHLEMNRFADELKVMDITGKTLISVANPEKQESIDLSEYHSGIYLIQLKFGDNVLYNKVVKK